MNTNTTIEQEPLPAPAGSGPTAHTPGPWCFGVTHTWPHGQPELKKLSLNIHGGGGQDGYAGNIIAVVAPADHISDQDRANARLIASAPEMQALILRLATWSKRWPRETIHSAKLQSLMDGELIELEKWAVRLVDGQNGKDQA